jgi:hypothetical protein
MPMSQKRPDIEKKKKKKKNKKMLAVESVEHNTIP